MSFNTAPNNLDVVFDEESVLIEDGKASISFFIDTGKLIYTDWFQIEEGLWGCLEFEGEIKVSP